ncbi:MAG: restriction endonuclease subunit S [Verrucomicrobiota bacterium]
MKYGLPKTAVEKICAVFAGFPAVEKAVLYGSRAKGNFKTGSDIDLTLYGEAVTSDLCSEVASALDDLLLPYTIDLSVFEELNHAKLREHIERVGVLFYERVQQGAAVKKGWQSRNLGELCEVIGGGTPRKDKPAYYSGKIPWATVRDMRQEVITETECRITKDAVQSSATNVIPSGNVVIATRVGLGKVCLVGQDTAINQDLRGVIPRDTKTLSVRFLFWWLKSIADKIVAEGTGATVQGVKLPFVKSLQIPVPPLPEQQRIVGILDEAFEGIATAKANAEKNLQNARALFESHLQSVLTQRGKGWVEKPFSDLCDIKHGYAFEGKFFSNEGDYVLLTPGNFYEKGGYRDRGEKQKYYTGEIPRDYVLNKGDLLVAMTEQAAGLLGSPILVPESDKFLHNQRLGLVIPKPGAAWTNEFFFNVFNTQPVRKAIHASASGVKVRHTSPTKIGKVVVSFPTSLSEQGAIVSTLNDLRAETQSLASLYARKLAALEALKKSLLHQAFTGQL